MEYRSLAAFALLLIGLLPTTYLVLHPVLKLSTERKFAKSRLEPLSPGAIERAGRLDTLLMDEVDAVTLGEGVATAFFPAPGVGEKELAAAAAIASQGDQSVEGRSIRALAEERCGGPGGEAECPAYRVLAPESSAGLRGVDFEDGTPPLRKGLAEDMDAWLRGQGAELPGPVIAAAAYVARRGGTPVLVALGTRTLGVVQLKAVVREGLRARLFRIRHMGIRTIMVSRRGPEGAAAIAAEAGFDDYEAEADADALMLRIRAERAKGHRLGFLCGKAEYAEALREVALGVAPASGSPEARASADMLSLDEDPTKLLTIAELGRGLRLSKRLFLSLALANDIARSLVVFPAALARLSAPGAAQAIGRLFAPFGLGASGSTLAAAFICNALVLLALLPVSTKGLRYRPAGTATFFGRNILAYGFAGLAAPFLGIKLISLLIHALG